MGRRPGVPSGAAATTERRATDGPERGNEMSASARPADGDAASTIALTLLTIAGILCMRRLFASWSYLGPVVLAAVAAHFAAWVCRVRNARAPLPFVAPLLAGVAVISWIQLPETTFYGFPTGE